MLGLFHTVLIAVNNKHDTSDMYCSRCLGTRACLPFLPFQTLHDSKGTNRQSCGHAAEGRVILPESTYSNFLFDHF